MNKEEVLEKYGDVKMRFVSYHEFTFKFKGVKDGVEVLASIVGDMDKVYNTYVNASEEETLRELDPNFIKVTNKDGVVYTWYDF